MAADEDEVPAPGEDDDIPAARKLKTMHTRTREEMTILAEIMDQGEAMVQPKEPTGRNPEKSAGELMKERVRKVSKANMPSPKKGAGKELSSAMRETRKLLLGDRTAESSAAAARRERSERLRVTHGGGETRMTVKVNGTPRQIRLDTQETEAERLNSLVRDVRWQALNAKNQEISARAKMQSIRTEVHKLQMERVSMSLEVPHAEPQSWREINTRKDRGQPSNLLQYVAPEKRTCHLRAIEKEALRAVEAVEVSRVPQGRSDRASLATTTGQGSSPMATRTSAFTPLSPGRTTPRRRSSALPSKRGTLSG